MLEFVGIAVGSGEALGCARCGDLSLPVYDATGDIVARIRDVAATWKAAPGPNILIDGPEPFAHPELPALIAACVEAGVERVALETDGAALSVPANAVGVLGAGVRHLLIRILDGEPERGDSLGGRPGRTHDALSGVKSYLDAAERAGVTVSVTAIVPVCEHNVGTLPETVGRLASAGFHGVRLASTGKLPRSAVVAVAAACDTGMVNRLWVESDGLLPLPETHRLHAVAGQVPRG